MFKTVKLWRLNIARRCEGPADKMQDRFRDFLKAHAQAKEAKPDDVQIKAEPPA
jgi:hypothetical protein